MQSPKPPSRFFRQAAEAFRAGRLEEARTAYQKALNADPGDVDALVGQGVLLTMFGETDGALASYAAAIAKTGDLEARLNRANLLANLGRHDEALAGLDAAAVAAPGEANVAFNRAVVLAGMHRNGDAIAAFEAALALAPDSAVLHFHHGAALARALRPGDAIAAFDRVLALEPNQIEALCLKGFALVELGRHDAAVACYDAALALSPGVPQVREQRAWAQLQLCDWAAAEPVLRAAADSFAISPQATPAPPGLIAFADDPMLQAAATAAWLAGADLPAPMPGLAAPHPAGEKLRIAYASADFHAHATMYLLADVLAAHDRERVEVTLLSWGPQLDDEWRARAVAAADRFVEVGDMSDNEVAALTRGLAIDVAVDLKGATVHARPGLFTARLAPVQVNWLGHPGTMAGKGWDYLLADATLIPAGAAGYGEAIARLPGSYQPASGRYPAPLPRSARADHGLPDDAIVFAGFNQLWKLTAAVFEDWLAILAAVPNSVLWLWSDAPAARARLAAAAETAGVAADRLVFAASLPHVEHLARLGLADLALDTFPCTAHTTAADALGMGLPLVTRIGDGFPARVAASLATAAGAAELVADSAEAYRALAIALAGDADRRAAIAARLAAAPSLHDPAAFARHLEAAFAAMDAQARAGLPPADLAIAP